MELISKHTFCVRLIHVFFLLFVTSILYGQQIVSDIENMKVLPFRTLMDSVNWYKEALRKPHLPQEQQNCIKKYNALLKQSRDSVSTYVQQHVADDFSSALLLYYYFTIDANEASFIRMYQPLRAAPIRNKYDQYLQEEIFGLTHSRVGDTMPIIELQTIDKKNVRLVLQDSTLLIFWASWCAPCRSEIAYLKKIYPHLREKGIQIISISLDDQYASWRAANISEQMPWLDLWSVQAWDSKIARFFALHKIPQNVFVTSTGVIISKNMQLIQLGK